ncbi:sucrase ferredoxin [Frankia sp. CiP3]|uniref:sucrase ferredoxin n=1 Tax=Frankia sp. CiP3 TaxID=2880971 RepID=UPI001EF4F3E2|nr:sucrase ferredoxin [Frankia sp. CiP3]
MSSPAGCLAAGRQASPRAVVCSSESRGIHEDLRGTIPRHRSYLFLPTPAPWPRFAGAAPASLPGLGPIPTDATTILYRSYPNSSAPLEPFLWNAHDRMITRGAARPEADRGPAATACPPLPRAPFLGVCIHGRHDPCCGLAGAPLLHRLHNLLPGTPAFGVSHIGGDRLAANAITLPSGYLLGRLDTATDEELSELALDGLLPLGHIRGRLGSTPAESVAEIWFRQRYGLRRPDDLPRTTITSQHGDHYTIAAEHGGRRHLLDIRRDPHEDGQIHFTCSATEKSNGLRWRITLRR